MNTDLRELFEKDLDAEAPYDLAERAVRGARTRRRNRLAVSASVVVTGAVVLGFVIGTGQLRTDDEPLPSDVAAIPSVLPDASSESVPNLQAGMFESASAAYVSNGMVVFVDSATGAVARRSFGPPSNGGGTLDVLVPVLDVALSPDGTTAAVVVDAWGRLMGGPTIRLLDIASAQETLVRDLTPAVDTQADALAAPSVVTWENDSQHFVCVCGPRLSRVATDGTWVRSSADGGNQVNAGTGGLAVQGARGRWGPVMLDGSVYIDYGGPMFPVAQSLAMSRGREVDYLGTQDLDFTIGNAYEAEPITTGTLLAPPGVHDFATASGVEAARDGYVVTTVAGNYIGSKGRPQVQGAQLVFVADDGQQGVISALPWDTESASIASDLVGAPEVDHVTGRLPAALPPPGDGVPFLAAGDVESASAVYFAQGALVVVDAESGSAYVIDALAAGLMTRTWAEALSLSPDGRRLVVAVNAGEGSAPLWFIDLANPRFVELPVQLATGPAAPVPSAGLAWSSDSSTLFCVCSSPGEVTQLHSVGVSNATSAGDVVVDRMGVQPTQLSSSAQGLLGLFGGNHWQWIPEVGGTLDGADPADAPSGEFDMVLLGPDPGEYLSWDTGGVYGLNMPSGRDVGITAPRWLAGVWGPDGPIVVTYSRGDVPGEPLEVSHIEYDGTSGSVAGVFPLSSLPEGTTAAAFSSLVVP